MSQHNQVKKLGRFVSVIISISLILLLEKPQLSQAGFYGIRSLASRTQSSGSEQLAPFPNFPFPCIDPPYWLFPYCREVNYRSYQEDTSNIPNPERGFYHQISAHYANFDPILQEDLDNYRSVSDTLILRLWYLEDFRDTDISDDYLKRMENDFQIIRNAGFKVIVRFGYTNHQQSLQVSLPLPPHYFNDANQLTVLRHISQLSSVLRKNMDVIVTVQAGFIGTWGEWLYSDDFSHAEPPLQSGGEMQIKISDDEWTKRRAVLTAMLNMVPYTRTVQVRTPLYKQRYLGDSVALASSEAFMNTYKARIGHHNDCFAANDTDSDTYDSNNILGSKAYLAQENHFVPQGGETCEKNSPYSDWLNAYDDLTQMHFSFLHRDHNTDVIDSWDSADPINKPNLETLYRRLGYRIRLLSGTFDQYSNPRTTFKVQMTFTNTGFAAPYNLHPMFLILTSPTSSRIWKVDLREDIRKWQPASQSTSYSVNRTICVPADMPSGDYQFYLHIQDPDLPTKPAYSIHLANSNVWKDATGYNDLGHTMKVRISNDIFPYWHYFPRTNVYPPCGSTALVLQ